MSDRLSHLRPYLLVLLGLGALLVGLVTAGGAELDAPTLGIVAAAGALVFFLVRMHAVVTALRTPEDDVVLAMEGLARHASMRELREEKRRVLSAIKELDFDFAMGKLSEPDYRAVREAYQLRAVEVLRALDARTDLHPRLREELARLERGEGGPGLAPMGGAGEGGASAGAAAKGAASASPAPAAARPCPACAGANDLDARFCKHCGVALGGAS